MRPHHLLALFLLHLSDRLRLDEFVVIPRPRHRSHTVARQLRARASSPINLGQVFLVAQLRGGREQVFSVLWGRFDDAGRVPQVMALISAVFFRESVAAIASRGVVVVVYSSFSF